VTSRDGKTRDIIHNGRLTALDDPEVQALASRYGDPDTLLREDWVPAIPGISAAGAYDDFARDPARWVYDQQMAAERVSL
jgi:hypothetical protein